nr:uncharacterized protein LOC113823140 [Penaeus vannamei]
MTSGGKKPTVIPDFDENLEAMLVSHIQEMEKCLFGLTPTDVQHLAFDFAEKKDSQSILQNHKDGSTMRNNLKVKYRPRQVWNMDETGISTVQKPANIVATKVAKSVGRITSGERGQTTSVLCAVSAAGVYIPTMFIFARKRMTPLMTGSPPGFIARCTTNGWSDVDCFLIWLHHFVSIVKPTQDEKHIIILDGHHSHKTLAAIDFARGNGIALITLPPHCTHKLKPLNVSYFKSLKAAYNRAAANWMLANAGKRITQYNIAEIFASAYMKMDTIDKAINGFKATGIWSFNDIFSDKDFIATQLTEKEAAPSTNTNKNTHAYPSSPDNPSESQVAADVNTGIDDVSLHDPSVSSSQDPKP